MSITAKPCIALVPYTYNTPAAIIVVMFASKIVDKERLLPARKALIVDFPERNSSFTLSKVIMLASTAIPTPRISAAIPGNVKTAFNQLKITNTK